MPSGGLVENMVLKVSCFSWLSRKRRSSTDVGLHTDRKTSRYWLQLCLSLLCRSESLHPTLSLTTHTNTHTQMYSYMQTHTQRETHREGGTDSQTARETETETASRVQREREYRERENMALDVSCFHTSPFKQKHTQASASTVIHYFKDDYIPCAYAGITLQGPLKNLNDRQSTGTI